MEVNPRSEQTLQAISSFVAESLFPLESAYLRNEQATVFTELKKLRQVVKNSGWWAPQLPQDLGGMGLSLRDFGHISLAIGQSPFGHFVFGCQAPDAGNAELLMDFGSEDQKNLYLMPLADGETRSCFAMTEPDTPGSDPVSLNTTAKKTSRGWNISGHKWFTSGAREASFCIVVATTNPEAPPAERASLFIVPTEHPGFQVIRSIPVMGEAGSALMTHDEVVFSDCEIGPEALLGHEGQGFRLAQSRLGPGRIHHCMRWLGIAERCLTMMIRRMQTRTFRNGKPLGDEGLMRAMLAENFAGIEAAKQLVDHTAKMIESRGASEARLWISTIKFHCGAVLQKSLDDAVQVHGALGMCDDSILAWFYRHERAARIYDGPDEVHKMSVGKQLLRR